MSLDWEPGRKSLCRVATAIATSRTPANHMGPLGQNSTLQFVPTEIYRSLPRVRHRVCAGVPGCLLGAWLQAAPSIIHPCSMKLNSANRTYIKQETTQRQEPRLFIVHQVLSDA